MAGGAAVAYVFLHLFPELALAQESFEESGPLDTGHEIYLLSMVGLAAFYGLERAAKFSRHERRKAGEEDVPGPTQVEIGELPLALLFAFLAGGIVLNVLKEDLPAERESRFSAFILGSGGYAAILLLL